nr:hypothetical protein [Tanacetum cinerariifolium]
MDINIDALYNILKQNQGDVNDVANIKKKAIVVTLDPLALAAEKIKVSKGKEKVVVHSESEESDDEDIIDLKKIIALVKDYNYYKMKMFLAKKDIDEQVLLAENQVWMKSSSDSDQEHSAKMVFVANMEKILLDSEESLSFTKDTIADVSYYTSDFETESKIKTLDYYDNSTNYGLFVENDDDQ